MSEPSPERRAGIEKLGATVIDPSVDDVAAAVHELSDGRGAAVYFDAAGAGPAIAQGIEALGTSGRLVVVGVHGAPVSINLWALQLNEIRLVGSLAYTPDDVDKVIEFMSKGAYPMDGWVDVRPLEDFVDVIGELRAGQGAKVLLSIP